MLRFSRGGRPPKTDSAARPVSDQVVTLKQFGITKTQSSQWEELAKIPDGEFEELLRAFRVDGVKPITAGLIRTGFWYHSAAVRSQPIGLLPISRCAEWQPVPAELLLG
jgi:hypothetical protein